VADVPWRFVGVSYTAETRDRDGDGIKRQIRINARRSPKTWTAFEDTDGLPRSRHNDGDGIARQRTTSVRNQAEDMDGFQDADGCPDPDNDGGRRR